MKRVFAHIGFSSAITLVILNFLSINGAFAVLGIASVLFVAFMLVRKTRKAVAVPLCLISCVLASVIFISFYYGSMLPQIRLADKETEIQFYITDIEQKTTGGYLYTVKTKEVSIENSPQNIKLSVYSDNSIKADYNQVVKARVNLTESADNGYNSYGKYADNIFLNAYVYDFYVTEDTADNPLMPVLKLKEAVIHYFLDHLEGDDAGLAIAMVTGCKNYISEETYNMFNNCGIMHILAVSGLHLSVFAGALYFLLKKFACPKVPTLMITMLFVILYMTFIGFTPSIIRAGIMFLVMCIAKLSKQKEDTLNSLGLVVFILCLNPYSVTDVGAMLTVTSVLGIITVYPKIKLKYSFKTDVFKYIFNTISLSVAVIITTMPVLYLFFGYQSLVFVVLNLILIPLVQLYLYVLSFSLTVSFSAVISSIMFYPVKLLSSAILSILELFSKLSYFTMDLSGPVVGLTIGLIFILIGATFIINKNKLRLSAVLSAVIFAVSVFVNLFLSAGNTYVKIIPGKNTSALFVYNHENAFAAGVTDYSQFSEISNIMEARNLTLYAVIDSDENSRYSRRLAENFTVLNYITDYDYTNYSIPCEEVLSISDFDVDLWQGFHVKYNYSESKETIALTLSGFSFAFTNDNTDVSDFDEAFYSDSVVDYDIVYTVNDYGYIERRENNWLK